MKLLKHIALGLFLAVSSVGVSSVAFAESDAGRISYEPAEAIDLVVSKIKEAEEAIKAGGDNMDIANIIKEAKDYSKEINANDNVDVRRQRANSNLTKARSLAKKGKLEESGKLLEEAVEKFAGLKAHL
ncbi:MAG: hypothetical protein Q9M50_09130 [Methylococcales bacterium]|nr:hypothetical protein [Methylococcales bacterium]